MGYPPSPTSTAPAATEDTGEAAPRTSHIATLWKRTRASKILDRMSSGLNWLGDGCCASFYAQSGRS